MGIDVMVALVSFLGLALAWIMLPGGARPEVRRIERSAPSEGVAVGAAA
jgi:hypothetical protein